MKKIIVTEEQAKVIDLEIRSCSSNAFRVVNISKKVELDLVTIAQIVEGYPYEVKREFKVGDIVGKKEDTSTWIVVSLEPFRISAYCDNKSKLTFEHNGDNFFLICKKENREDLGDE